MDFKERIAALLEEHGIRDLQIEVPPNPALGDYAMPCFALAKERKAAPQQIAQELASTLNNVLPDYLEKVTAAGPYVNFFVKPSLIVAASFDDPHYPAIGKKVVVEYSSPNIAKPFGIGHLRSTVIGGALRRIYEYAGWTSIGINHPGDWGTQFGKLIAAYKRWPTDISEEPVKKLLELYVRFHDEAEKNPSLEDAGREEFRKLEQGDPENRALWEQFRKLSLAEFESIWAQLNCTFDETQGEAFYTDKMMPVVEELKEKDILEEDEGALIVRFTKEEGIETPAIILKSDGTTIYATRDLAAALYRKQKYNFDRMLYEVGGEQQLHFKQVFAILKRAGYDWADECHHVWHGLYRFEEGKMSTRRGKVIFIDDVLKQAIDLSRKTIEEKNPDLKNKEEVAQQVGIGAIIFFDLKNDRTKDIVFDWNDILNFEGESGPYLQYTYARLKSAMRKSSETPVQRTALLTTPEELAVARQLNAFREAIDQAVQNNKPHIIARYLLDLAQLANSSYQKHRVIQEDKELEQARLALTGKAAERIKLGLALLGIDTPEEM